MARRDRKTIHFRGRDEPVLETFHVRGRSYFALERLSRRGAFRVFDPLAAPGGDYRILYRFPASKTSRQRTEILRRLSGPHANRNFPQLVECIRSGGDLFVVLSWVWGTNLRDYLRAVREQETPRPSASETVRLMRGMAHGIGHFHRRTNIIHGDISPANIVITTGTKQLVMVDFGSAWPVEESATKESGDGVTQPYAAPERLANHAAEDLRSDIFSLSVVAYECSLWRFRSTVWAAKLACLTSSNKHRKRIGRHRNCCTRQTVCQPKRSTDWMAVSALG